VASAGVIFDAWGPLEGRAQATPYEITGTATDRCHGFLPQRHYDYGTSRWV
jgi:hypothetical protein